MIVRICRSLRTVAVLSIASVSLGSGTHLAAQDLDTIAQAVAALDDAQESDEPYRFDASVIEEFLEDTPPFGIGNIPDLNAFDAELRESLRENPSIEAATLAMASQTDLDAQSLSKLIRLWVEAPYLEYGWADWQASERERWRAEFAAFARAHTTSLLPVTAAAMVLDSEEDCEAGVPVRLAENHDDPTAANWAVAIASHCSASMANFARQFPDRALAALVEFEHYGWLELADKLPVSEWLAKADIADRIAPADRETVLNEFDRRYLTNLLSAGYSDRAVAFYDGLSPAHAAALFELGPEKIVTRLDGLPLTIKLHGGRELTQYWPGKHRILQTRLAIAMFLVGRKAQARELLTRGGLLEETRDRIRCLEQQSADRKEQVNCNRLGTRVPLILMLGHALEAPDADPYLIAETTFGSAFSSLPAGSEELICALFQEDRFGDICDTSRSRLARRLLSHLDEYNRQEHEMIMTAVLGMELPGFAEIAADHAKMLEAQLDITGRPDATGYERASIDPVFPHYEESALPAGLSAYTPPSNQKEHGEQALPQWPSNWAALTPGFSPVRWEQSENRAAVVSVSSYYNPSGEISQGGYWVHLSDDGGRTWKTPLFTGLAQYWPYVVPPVSELAMLGEDGLTLEVAVAELDTASITYPPIGLSTRREAVGLVLNIPFARLKADSDGDYLSDISETHLLLDRLGEGRPFILGSGSDAQCPQQPTRQTLATSAILSRIFRVDSRAIVEPVNRVGEQFEFGNWQSKESPFLAPLFLRGDPADFACVNTETPVIVYSEEQVEQLQRHSPDFRTVALPKGVWNEDFTRGYVEWSAGWTGGTLRLIWNGKDWDIDQISSWIT